MLISDKIKFLYTRYCIFVGIIEIIHFAGQDA